jgi:hypothetical protein
MTATLIEWAHWYAAHGHPVLPLHTPFRDGCSCRNPECQSIGKHPRIQGGLTNASTDSAQVAQWWQQWPLANIGLRTGITCFALDIDPRKGGDAELFALQQTHAPLPDTPRSKTGGGGEHVLFALPENVIIRNRTDFFPGIDMRGEGGYIVVPPSSHVSGHNYCWDADLDEMPLAQAPPWLLDLYTRTVSQPPTSPEEAIGNGRRNNTLSSMAFMMRKAGMSLKEIRGSLGLVNMRCVPPLDEEELLLIVNGKRHIGPDPILRTSHTREDAPKVWPTPSSANDILGASHPLPRWLVDGLIPEGLTIVGGLPKVAKSYFAYDLALAASGDGLGLRHFGVNRSKVLYLALEDDAADIQIRIRELRPELTTIDNLYFLYGEAVPTISEGLADYLREQVLQQAFTFVIIDPLAYVYDPKVGKQTDSFREAKEMLLPLRQLARELHFSLMFVDHRRKQGRDDGDIFQTLYGSVAKYALADAMIMMIRRGEEVILHCRGRRIKDQMIACEFALRAGEAIWTVHGASAEFANASLKTKILNGIKEAERLTNRRAFSLSEILAYAELENTSQMRETVRLSIFRMCKTGEVLKTERGLFLLRGDDDERGVLI